MNNTMKVKVAATKDRTGKELWETIATVPGLRPTKIEKSDGNTRFATRSAAMQAANAFARKFNLIVATNEKKVAAKRSVKS